MSLPPRRRATGAPPAEPIIRLGDYFLLEKLAQGGMAEIFLAKKVGVGGFEKTLVLKRMLDSLSGSPEFVGMFFDEAKLVAKLTHPNIAQIYDFGVIEGRYYIAMEHIPGEDTRTILTRCWEQKVKIPVGIALKIIIDVCAGLEHAHDLEEGGKPLGIIHRDVSPSNVMVSYQGAVKLLDFGIAKATSRMSETLSGNVKGKYSFLSPEQIEGKPIDARSDLFALGITFFELLTKRRPFRRDNELATIHAILHDEIPDPRELRSNLPEDIAIITRKALARNPEDRYQSAALMRADLQDVLTRIAPGLGQADVVKFMLALFGRDERERKTHVPMLAEVPGIDVTDLQLRAATPVGPTTPPPGILTPPESQSIVLSGERVAFSERSLEAAKALDAAVVRAQRRARGPARLVRRPTLWMGMLAATAVLGAIAAVTSRHGREPKHVAAAAVATLPREAPSTARPTPTSKGEAQPARPAPISTSTPTPTSTTPESEPPAARPAPLQQLSGAALQAIVKRAQGRLSACFKQHSELLPAATGQVTIELAVSGSGRVTDASTSSSEVASTPLGACLVEEARRIRFPRHPDRELRFNFALVYRKGD